MEAIKEREQFSKRLRETLKRAGEACDSPAALAHAFNRRYPGKPVSNYAARKWLMGEAIPSQDKLRILAKWLGVANDWLRFGDGAKPGKNVVREESSGLDYELMRSIAILSEEHQTVVRAEKG
jgi:transcriptional regulator with XRE-family HTH domain